MEKIPGTIRKGESAYVMVTCESGSESVVYEELRHMEGIKKIESTMGNYDIILMIEAESTELLQEIIAGKIRHTPHIRATTTLICTFSACPLLTQSV